MNAPPRRPVLAPGLTVLVRRPGELQIGRTDLHRLVLADSPAVRRTLAVLQRGEAPPADEEIRRVLDTLAPVLRDGDALVRPGLRAAEVAAIALRHPSTADARARAREAARITVVGDWPANPFAVLAGSGLTGTHPRTASTAAVTATLVLCHGDLDRRTADGLVRARVPHLLVRALESEILLGPFVLPGTTACLRCVDLHRSAADPTYAVPPQVQDGHRHDGVPDPCDGALATMAIGWAVSDLVRYVEGDRPSTWSATVTLEPGRTALTTEPWTRHPACGCGWTDGTAADAGASVMMGA